MTSTNLSYLHSNRGTLQMVGFPKTTLNITSFNIPGITLPPSYNPSPFSEGVTAGDKITWDDLTFEFLVDEKLENWREMYDWLIALGAPNDKSEQYLKDLRSTDISVIVFDAQNNAILNVKFADCVPISLSGIDMSEEVSDTQYKKATMSLAYHYYEMV